MKAAYSILILSAAMATLVMIWVSGDKPKAEASPTPIIDHSAELAALQAENADLKEQLAAANTPAMQVAELPAPVVAALPAAGALKHSASLATLPLARSQSCAGGFCQPAAMAPKQYQYQSRSSQPRRFFGGRIFGRR
jgi:hypothetical protein